MPISATTGFDAGVCAKATHTALDQRKRSINEGVFSCSQRVFSANCRVPVFEHELLPQAVLSN